MDIWFFGLSVAISLLLYLVALVGFQRGWIPLHTQTDNMVAELKKQVEWLRDERNQLLSEVLSAKREIEQLRLDKERLELEIGKLRQEIAVQQQGRVRVLGIWPQKELDGAGERDAIADAGTIDYIGLFGEAATKERILRELRIDGFSIIEIGAHGSKAGILIWQDELLDAGFWAVALARRTIRIAILLACYSDLSIADAFRRAGVRYVIAATDEIADKAAVRFVRTFYQGYADGLDVPRAFDEARLVIDKREREKLVLR